MYDMKHISILRERFRSFVPIEKVLVSLVSLLNVFRFLLPNLYLCDDFIWPAND